MSMNQGLPSDGGALVYRVSSVEEEIRSLKGQLDRFVTTRENDLKLDSIKGTVQRIEGDVSDIKKQMIAQEQASKERDVVQQQEQSQFKIRVLWGVLAVLGTVAGTVVAALIINFLMHTL